MHDHAHGDAELDHLIAERINGPVDQLRPVIGGDDLHPFRQRGLDLFDLLLYAFNDRQHVLAESNDHDPAHGLTLAVEVRHAAPDLGAELDRADVPEQDRRPLPVSTDSDLLDVRLVLDISAAADHVFAARPLHDPALDIAVAPPDRLHHLHERQMVGQEPVGVNGDLVLLHEPAYARDFGNAWHGFEGILERPVLERPELGKVMFSGFIDQGVLKSPTDTRGIRSEERRYAGGKFARHTLEILEHTAPRPINVRSVLEDRIDKGKTEEGLAPHSPNLRRCKKGGHDGIGDLVLDQVGAPSRPVGEHDHLDIGKIGDRVERRMIYRPDAPERQETHKEEYQELISR